MGRHLWALGALLAAAFEPALAQITVMAPLSLQNQFADTKGRIDGSTATFGAPFYGDRVIGRLVYAESKLDKNHCTAADYDIPSIPDSKTATGQKVINIVLVRRGKCSFVSKVKVAAAKGAHAVIIVDRLDSSLSREDLQNIIVADDGFGGSITIPSVLVTKEDGQKLMDATKVPGLLGEEVIVEMSWDIPSNHVVVMDQWMSSGSSESMKFLRDFAEIRRKLGYVVIYQPHFAVFGIDKNQHSAGGLCLDESGEYCAEDPDGPGPVTGKDVLLEDVRQHCIHESHKTKRISEYSKRAGMHEGIDYNEHYWKYVELFGQRCSVLGAKAKMFGQECSENLMKEVGIDVEKVKDCVRLETGQFLKDQKEHQAWSPRALRINSWRYSGIMDTDLVTRAICSGFINTPKECEEIIKPRDPTNTQHYVSKERMGWFSIFKIVGIAMFVLLIPLLLYRRYLKKEMRMNLREEVMLEVQAQLGEYTRMSGSS